eukprot:1161769-Pelagomonas_calceolata.AAC.8
MEYKCGLSAGALYQDNNRPTQNVLQVEQNREDLRGLGTFVSGLSILQANVSPFSFIDVGSVFPA